MPLCDGSVCEFFYNVGVFTVVVLAILGLIVLVAALERGA